MLIPHSKGQAEVLTAPQRFKVLCAGRRWGKTKVGAARALRVARQPRRTVWWVAPQYKHAKRAYEEVLAQLPNTLLAKPAPPIGGFDAGRAVRLEFKTGSKIEFYSAERPEGMLGGYSDMVVIDEAATMPEHVWSQIIRPTLADRRGEALFISTPRGFNWFYRLWANGQDPLQPEYRSWRFPSFTNPTIPAEEWEGMRAELPLAVYEQEVLAEFISNAAAVFRKLDNAVRPMHTPSGHVVLGVDLAKHSDFSVIYGVRASDRLPCFHDRFNQVSWPAQRSRIHTAIDEVERQGASSVTIMLDSTGLGDVIYDDLTDEGLDTVPVKFTPQWKQMAVTLLSADLERGDAFLLEDQIDEFRAYSYTISEATGRMKYEAQSGHDDEVSAALLAHWGLVHEGVPDAKLLTSGDGGGDYIDSTAEELPPAVALPALEDLINNPAVWG